MSLEPKIMARLRAEVSAVGERVYFGVATQGVARPYLVVSKVSDVREYSHDGYSGIRRPRYQLSVYGDAYVQAKVAAEEVIEAMEGWQADGIRFAPVAGVMDMFEEDTGLHHVPVDVFIHYDE